ncbi:regulator of nonsense transcripts 2-like protein, partial [Euroglyphus maynei]
MEKFEENEATNTVDESDSKNVNDDNKNNDDKQQEQQQQDEQSIRDYIKELTERFREKRQKRYENDQTNIEYPDEELFVRLDTSIKKNTAFVKKIRNMTESNKDIIMKDLENLNLTRFISELATALVETKIKATEIGLFIQICSFLHRRYTDFASHLFDAWNKNLPRKPTDTFNASKMRVDIKIFTELILSGIFTTKDSLPALGNLLTILTNADKEMHKNINILIVFCRCYGVEFAGIHPRRQRLLAEKFQLQLPVCDFLSQERQKGVQTLLKDYYQSLIQHISKDRKYLFHLKNDMKRNLETRGEVSETLQEKWKTKSTEFEKLHQSTATFADLIDEQMPDIDMQTLENDTMLMKNENVTAVLFDMNRFKENNPSIWDDEETRIFYEKLPDLKSLVPAMLYKDSLKDESIAMNNNTVES